MDNFNCFRGKSLFQGIGNLNRCEMLALINAATVILTESLDDGDLNSMGNFFTAIGANITALAAIQEKSETQSK